MRSAAPSAAGAGSQCSFSSTARNNSTSSSERAIRLSASKERVLSHAEKREVAESRLVAVIAESFIPGRSGGAWLVRKDQHLRVIDVAGSAIGDFVCFNADKLNERFSQARTKANQGKMLLSTGDRSLHSRQQRAPHHHRRHIRHARLAIRHVQPHGCIETSRTRTTAALALRQCRSEGRWECPSAAAMKCCRRR